MPFKTNVEKRKHLAEHISFICWNDILDEKNKREQKFWLLEYYFPFKYQRFVYDCKVNEKKKKIKRKKYRHVEQAERELCVAW